MVSISNSVGSVAYSKSAQLAGATKTDPGQVRLKTTKTEDQAAAHTSHVVDPNSIQRTQRTDLPQAANAVSNDAGRFQDNKTTQLQETHDDQTLNKEAQRGSLLDLAV